MVVIKIVIFYRFFVCEVLNFVNVIGQIFFIDTFLNGEFSTYGLRVFEYTGLEPEERPDPMAVVFPKVIIILRMCSDFINIIKLSCT